MTKRARDTAQELLLRRRVRGSLAEWARLNAFEPAAHHRLLIAKLEAVSRGEIKRLAIFMPPGSAKSTYTSKLFPSWYLSRHKGSNLIAASHTQTLAERWGRHSRNLITEYKHVLDLELASDSAAAGRWALTNGSEYLAAGAGGAIAGYRADGALIDDPIRSREDADSEQIRNKLWDWYKSDVITRLRPGGWIILIQTRWHVDDLAGRLLGEMEQGGERWEILSLPAEAGSDDPLGRQVGELLWADDAYGYGEHLRREKATQSPRNWASLYQQTPIVEGGNYFKEEWLKPYYQLPDDITRSELRTYIGTDFAVTSKGGDYSVIVVVGLDHRGDMYLLDLYRRQAASDEWIDAYIDMMERWKPLECAEESGQITAGVGPFLEKRMMERHVYAYRKQFPSRHDKSVRAQSIRGRMAVHGLYVPAAAPWYSAFLKELMEFPASKHDDVVDALSLVGQLLVTIGKGKDPAASNVTPIWHLKEPQKVSLNKLWDDYGNRPIRRERM